MSKPDLFVCNCCFGDIICARFKCIVCTDYDLCHECLFQAESDSCGSHDPSTHVLLKIYIAEESPLLFNENNDIIDQLALFDSLQIFKQDVDSMSKHMQISSKNIKLTLNRIFDEVGTEYDQTLARTCPDLLDGEDLEIVADSPKSSPSLALKLFRDDKSSTESSPSIVTIWDSLLALANYDDGERAFELILHDKWAQMEAQMQKFNFSQLLRGQKLSEIFRRLPECQKQLQRIPWVVSQGDRQVATQRRKLLIDAVLAGSRSKTAKYVHEILVEAAAQFFSPSRQNGKERSSSSSSSSSSKESERGAIQRIMGQQSSQHKLDKEEEEEEEETEVHVSAERTARGVNLCVGLSELVAALHTIEEWWEENFRREENKLMSVVQSDSTPCSSFLSQQPCLSQRKQEMPLLHWKVKGTFRPSVTSLPIVFPFRSPALKRVLVYSTGESSHQAGDLVVATKRARREREVIVIDRALESSFVLALSEGLNSQQTLSIATSVTPSPLMLNFIPTCTSDSAWLMNGLRHLMSAINVRKGGWGAEALIRSAIALLSWLKISPIFIKGVVEFLRQGSHQHLAMTHYEPPLLNPEPLEEHDEQSTSSLLFDGWDWPEGSPTSEQRFETQLRSEAYFSSSQLPFSIAEQIHKWAFQPIVLHPLTARQDNFLTVPVALRDVNIIPRTIEIISEEPRGAPSLETDGLDDDLRFFDALFEGSSQRQGEEVEGDLDQTAPCVTSESTIESSPEEDGRGVGIELSQDTDDRSARFDQSNDFEGVASAPLRVMQSILKKRPMCMSRIVVRHSPSRRNASNKRVRFSTSPAIDSVVTDDDEGSALPSMAAHYRSVADEDWPPRKETEEVFDFFASKDDHTGDQVANSKPHRIPLVVPLFGSPVSPPQSSASSGSSSDDSMIASSQNDWMFGSLGSFDFEEEESVIADSFAAITANKYGKHGKRKEKM